MPITLLDGALLLIMVISALLAMIRGFTREVFSIASWVAAAAATFFLWERVLPFTQQYVEDKNIALGVTLAGIFFLTLFVVSLVTMKISDFILDSKAGPLDRMLGFAFGAGRGLILVVIGMLFVNFFIPENRQPEWIAQSKSKPWLDGLGTDLLNALPEDPEGLILDKIKPPDETEKSTPQEPTEATEPVDPEAADAPAGN